MERLAPSIAQTKIFKETGLETVEELVYADLRAAGWDRADAFYAAYRDSFTSYPKRELDKMMKRMDSDPRITSRMDSFAAKDEEPRMGTADLARETSKEKILTDLVIARKRMKEGTKEWAELTKMIGDYAKIKQDEIKTSEEPIRYFLPVSMPTSCKDCIIGMNKRGEVPQKG